MTSLRAEVDYLRQLADAGWKGIAAARREFAGPVFDMPRGGFWRPAAVGAVIGILGGRLTGNRKDKAGAAMAGLAGSVVGSAVFLAWTSRRFTRAAANKAIRSVNTVRDQHWLAANPIDYA